MRGAAVLLLLVPALGAACGAPPPPAPTVPAVPRPQSPSPAPAPAPTPAPRPAPAPDSDPPIEIAAPGADPDFPAKSPPKPGDWLAHFRESGQTVEEFADTCRNFRSKTRRRILLQPMGGIADRRGPLLEKAREYAAAFFATEAVLAEPLPLPERAWVERRGQWDASRILVVLGSRVEEEDLAVLGLCEGDLFAERLNFVFGLASPFRRSGAWSIHRFGGDGDAALLRRLLQVETHEGSHLLGLEHCVRYECLLNGSNSLAESDRAPLHACPECGEKLRRALGFDPRRRWEALAAFYEREGLAADAALALRQARR